MTHLLRARAIHAILFAVTATTFTACSDDDATGPDDNTDYSQYLQDFSQKVAVATYTDMKEKAALLNAAVRTWANDPENQTKLDAAVEAWVAMREPWEASEAFLFGPAEFLALDPKLDSWPVDEQQLEQVLSSELELTPEFIEGGLGEALRGFHTAEYLLFKDGEPRNVAEITSREREYLVGVTEVLASDAATLADAWTGGFADEFANAGKAGSRYATQTDAVREILEGMVGIADEVANGKIADPFDEQDPNLVESQFSWNSLTDFKNNIRSIRNSYMGGYHNGTDGKGLNELVVAEDPALDTRVQAEIQAAIDAIDQIPEPFRNNLTATTQITAAQQAIEKLATTLQEDVTPLITD